MKIWIEESEKFPFYRVYDEDISHTTCAEISEEQFEWIKKTMDEYYKVEEFLRKLDEG